MSGDDMMEVDEDRVVQIPNHLLGEVINTLEKVAIDDADPT